MQLLNFIFVISYVYFLEGHRVLSFSMSRAILSKLSRIVMWCDVT